MSISAPNVPAVVSESPSATIVVNVKDIKSRNLPNNGLFKRLDKFYVEFVIDGQLKHTKSHTAKGSAASWAESFYFDALGSSMLECRVHTKHKIGSDDFIGGTKDTIDSLLTEEAGGVVTRELCKFDAAHGNPCNTQTILEFMIAAVPKASDAGVLNMEEAIAQQREVLDSMIPGPSSVKPIQETNDTSATWGPLLQKIKLFCELVDSIAEIHPYAKMAWNILSATHKTIIAQADHDDCIVHLVQVMDDVYSFVKEAEPMKKIESHRRIVALMAQQTTECAYFIRDYAMNKSFWKRALENSFMSDVDSKIKQYEDKLKELKMAFQDRAILRTGITVSRIMDTLESLALDFDLGDMPYAKGARFDPDKGCLPGTREAIMEEITQWVNSPDGDNVSRIFFLSGVAGSGKSAIAHTIAHLFDQQMRLGSSYCFDRADQVNRRPSNLLSTISLNIADLDQNWKTSLCNTIKGNRSLCTTLSVTEQFKKFILEPVKALTTVGPILIVIDAMDESAEEFSRKTLLDVLAKGISDLPSNFRFLITARPERDIINAFSGNQYIFCKHMSTIDEASNDADIGLFIESQLSGVDSLESEWPNKLWCRMLSKSSGGLFQWASTACRAIKETKGGLRPTERLSRFVSSGRGLDALYTEVLHQAFDAEDDTVMSRFRLVMGSILVTRIPLSILTHSELRADGDPADLVELIVQSMGSLLSGVNQPHIPIRALHASFFDFLTDPDRSKSYYVDPSHYHRTLTLSSLRIMKSGLRFNICGLETSHIRNTDVPGLNTRVEKAIAQHLSYACIFWADHLIVTGYDAEILDEIINFFQCRLLYWVECLSLMKRVNIASRMLHLILDWNQCTNDDVTSFAKDAAKLISVFGSAISQSTPHIYLSALSFAPEGSRVAEHYRPLFPKILNLRRGKADDWPAIVAVMEGHTEPVNSVAFSQDGKRIISGSDDHTIRVWDSETGDVVLGPLEGHTSSVYSVAFSRDGKRIVSGSDDKTIRIWDSETGDVVLGPLEGHTSSVNSVAFSQDGKRIVSGSSDQTIRIWDSETGNVALRPLEGHTGWVNSVAISQDGKRIISGSDDQTVRVWDSETGDVVLGPLEGHTSSVRSVAFSQDGKRIISGSSDHTIRVWDSETGDVVLGPLEGHTSSVYSVAFSQDGKHIVSGSHDQTFRVWDSETGDVVLRPLEGHTGWVNSVAFSQDGKRIVSGSYDHTIRVWDSETGDVVLGPLEGHTSWVRSVAFSQDGKRIVSGSSDQTIRVWDSETGDVVLGPLEGHTSSVYSVAFSQDGKRIVSGSFDQTIRVWDSETGDVVLGPLEGHSWVYSVAFSQDGKRIVSGWDDRTIRVWDSETGDVVLGPLKGHTNWVISVAFSQDSKRIVSGSFDHTIRIWDSETGDVVLGPLEGHTSWVSSVVFSQDSKRIVSGSSDRTIRVWDSETGDVVLGPLEGHTGWVSSVAFSQDGKRIVSGSSDQTIRVWNSETGDVVLGPLEGHTGSVYSVAFSQDGKRIVSGSHDHTIRVWDSEMADVVLGPLEGRTSSVNSVAFSQDGKHIVSGSYDQTVRVWDSETGDVVLGPLEGHTSSVYSVAFSQDSKCIISGSSDQTIRIWDSETGDVVLGPLEGHTSSVYSVAFSQDGKRIISGSDDHTIRVWDSETGDVVLGPVEGHTGSVNSVAFSQDGKRIISGSDDQTIRVWDSETGDVVLGPLEGHTSLVNFVAFSQDSKHIVSGSHDHTIRVWDSETGNVVLGPLKGHTSPVYSVAFSQDGKRIVSGSSDQTIRVWDSETGDVILGPLEGHTSWVRSVAFSQDSKRIVSGSSDQTIRVWDSETGDVVLGPLKGHTSSINSIAFSQDGKCTVSGLFDKTIQFWDANIRQVVQSPLEGHTCPISPAPNDGLEDLFNNNTRLEGGWIVNSSSSLIFWVPSWNRKGLYWPRTLLVIGRGVLPTQLDLHNFVHGDSWHGCKV